MSGYLEVDGICIHDTVEVTSKRVGFEKVRGIVTAIAHGPGITTYFRVRAHAKGYNVSSQWFLNKEVTRLGDFLYAG